eukprot:TRINITY_DN9171_c0_g2_i1.p1 TRINITY_DN9171_c0_g2~~TRINITY_DN9171_c0_g2_i1.p1  ORF type:complete len:1175 (+),score=276.28 TRINITY_DN9171_c0_g2_i1:853-4377(+)
MADGADGLQLDSGAGLDALLREGLEEEVAATHELDGEAAFDARTAAAAERIARQWKARRSEETYNLLAGAQVTGEARVQVPWSPGEAAAVPTSLDAPRQEAADTVEVYVPEDQQEAAWQRRLQEMARRRRRALGEGVKQHRRAQLAYYEEVGRFAAACRHAAVLVVHEILADLDDSSGAAAAGGGGRAPASMPRRINREDPLWQQVRPRFDMDRVFACDSLVLTVVLGSIEGDVDIETAWKIYQNDMCGAQVLADAIDKVELHSPFAFPHYCAVKYCGFKVICRPQYVPAGSGPFELVVGPLPEAGTAPGGQEDLPDLWRACAGRNRKEVSLVLHEWEQQNPELRRELQAIAEVIGLQGYPVIFDASDLPVGIFTTALVRSPGNGDLHFRTPAELLPPEVLSDERRADPLRRWRAEALRALAPELPPLPLTHRASGITSTHGGGADGRALHAMSVWASKELPRRLLDRIGKEGPPLDSRGWTKVFHDAGCCMRHLGRVAAAADNSLRPPLYREALARSVKWLFRRALWTRRPWGLLAPVESESPEVLLRSELVRFFNLALGTSQDSYNFWELTLIPETARRFGIPPTRLLRKNVAPGPFFQALQHHLSVRFHPNSLRKGLFSARYPEPFEVEDLASFQGSSTRPWFPHVDVVSANLERLENRVAPLPPEARLSGFYPDTRVVCSRGGEWLKLAALSGLHATSRDPQQLYNALNLRLSLQRSIGDGPCDVGVTLQDIAVSLLEVGNGMKGKDEDIIHRHFASEAQGKVLKEAVAAADHASGVLPFLGSAWWAQLAALEAEWQLGRSNEAAVRLERMQAAWETFAPDMPLLRLRLEGVMTRLAEQAGYWGIAARHAEMCHEMALRCFGGAHQVSILLLARLGDIHAAKEDWRQALAAYARCLGGCQGMTSRDVMMEGRLNYEMGRAHMELNDIIEAKNHIEEALRVLVPRFKQDTRAGAAVKVATNGSEHLALDALYLAGEIYACVAARVRSVATDASEVRATEPELVRRAVRCFEFYLENSQLGPEHPRLVSVVREVLRLRIFVLSAAQKQLLVEAVEQVMVLESLRRDEGSPPGLYCIDLRSQTYPTAEATLNFNPMPAELATNVDKLCASIAVHSRSGGLMPSAWFDDAFESIADGGGEGQGVMHLLLLHRHFCGKVHGTAEFPLGVRRLEQG